MTTLVAKYAVDQRLVKARSRRQFLIQLAILVAASAGATLLFLNDLIGLTAYLIPVSLGVLYLAIHYLMFLRPNARFRSFTLEIHENGIGFHDGSDLVLVSYSEMSGYKAIKKGSRTVALKILPKRGPEYVFRDLVDIEECTETISKFLQPIA